MIRAGYYLKKPFFSASSTYLNPENLGFFKGDFSLESVKKISQVALAGLQGLVSIPLYFLGASLIAVNSVFNPQDFYLRQFTPVDLRDSSEIKIGTYNICGFEGGFPILFGGMEPVANRVDALATKILNADLNIVCLQEAQYTTVQGLSIALQAKFPYQYLHIGESSLFFPSGLAVFSDRPLENPQYVPYEGTYFMNRGLFEFDVGDKHFITTHLSPGSNQELRDSQLDQLKTHISSKPSNTILGDFNHELSKIGEISRLEIPDLTGSLFTATNTYKWRKTGHDQSEEALEFIDHILTTKGKDLVIDPHYGINSSERPISDHLLVTATIQ
jgi:endonuclease/exonuclease/phosphatase family metal-dependent hydrolase